ncbi:MAG TPA: hypothetical protein PLY34_16990 [Ferruginibacter sp.]|nr:hypothetical protein [Ferruginibacter sp.]
MKLTKLLCLSGIAISLFASCKKDSANPDNNTPVAVDASGNLTVSSDADGACYSIISRYYDNNAGSGYDDFHSTYAWFGSTTAFKDGGTVSVNTYELTNIGGINTYTYVGLDELFPSNAAAWDVSGNSANDVPAFTYTDNTAFPTGGDFVLPSSINLSNPLTVNFSAISNVAGVVFSLRGNKGTKSKAVANGASSVTFSVQELNEAAFANDAIAVAVMPVVYTSQTINGKKIYFVKQFQTARETATL